MTTAHAASRPDQPLAPGSTPPSPDADAASKEAGASHSSAATTSESDDSSQRPLWQRLLETGLVPDLLVRFGIRRLLSQRLREGRGVNQEDQQRAVMDWVAELRRSKVAVETDAANEQHYEVPAVFYEHVLGPRLKYSSGLWGPGTSTLAEAEIAMLQLVEQRAGIEDGMDILDLGCGWGSLSLWLAERFPNANIVGLSNSASQREFIMGRAKQRGLGNLDIVTRNATSFDGSEFEGRFDRVCSIEMMEHVRNYDSLLAAVARTMRADARFFVHIFTHRDFAYPYDDQGGQRGWMARHFFTGGQMPSDHLLLYFQDRLKIEEHWRVDGTHYGKTADAWLDNMDQAHDVLRPAFDAMYGKDAKQMWVYWRVFFMACAELWNYAKGSEWFVSHYLFSRRPDSVST
jgi:cyclopropane-fatty-acyl-phospholipid synthase